MAVIGAGSVGIAVAYYLVKEQNVKHVLLIDPRDPMSLTSAQSGENYRNWWPHPIMTAFTDFSTNLMEKIDIESGGRINMTRGGYALVTRRKSPEDLIEDLHRGYAIAPEKIRLIDSLSQKYKAPLRAPWTDAPDGVDVLMNQALIRKHFPAYAKDISTVIHIRRAGSISAQQLGQYMLEEIRTHNGKVLQGEVKSIKSGNGFNLEVTTTNGIQHVKAEKICNAAGPYLKDIASMLNEEIPVHCVYQQKIAFQDREAAVPRNLPFTIDLDGQILNWSDEDHEILASDPSTKKFIEPMLGGIHCRPDGAVDGTWIKLGWAYNHTITDPHAEDPIDPQFPDTVIRGASRLNPRLATYIGRLPRGVQHYGGYYTMTEENWPLIGPMKTEGAFIAGALSGFGSMAACATGSLCAAWVMGQPVPEYAKSLSSSRYEDKALMAELARLGKGTL